MKFTYGALVLAAMLSSASLQAAPQLYRWTLADGLATDLPSLVALINQRAGTKLTVADFKLNEDRPLAFTSYLRYDQVVDGVPVGNQALRLWLSADKKSVVQAEAFVDATETSKAANQKVTRSALVSAESLRTAAIHAVSGHKDFKTHNLSSELQWQNGVLTYVVKLKAQRGEHEVSVNAYSGKIVKTKYDSYPDADSVKLNDGYSIKAQVYPIYEEAKGQILPRVPVELKHIQATTRFSTFDPYKSLRDKNFLYSLLDPIRAQTDEGRAAGYWSMQQLQADADALTARIPAQDNLFYLPGVRLTGKYVDINLHPDVVKTVNLGVEKRYSTQYTFNWLDIGNDDYKLTPMSSLIGRRWPSPESVYNADNTRDPQHNVGKYVVSGFDEIQVYYAVNQLFETLRPRGWIDEDLGSRPFHAFLFNPDIEMKNNAFYDSDTINFTTYSPDQPNYARDNLTIWHELGHGVMDRLMGTRLHLADTGGLSEGMADFVAEMVLQANTTVLDFPGAEDRRIVNRTGFFLTNEVHDDGEAYGGTMRNILEFAKEAKGAVGVNQIIDLTLEAMRLTRDHPALTAQEWFSHMMYADTLGRPGLRAPGELTPFIQKALDARNFASEAERGDFSLKFGDHEILAGTAGSRSHEIAVNLGAKDTKSFDLTVKLREGKEFHFVYPVQVKVFYNSGPLQGAIDWVGEDQEPTLFTINSANDVLTVPVTVKGTCDEINRDDGSCSDFAYVQIWNKGENEPVAKKRFYLRVKTQ